MPADATRYHRQFAGAVADRFAATSHEVTANASQTTLTNNCSIKKPPRRAAQEYLKHRAQTWRARPWRTALAPSRQDPLIHRLCRCEVRTRPGNGWVTGR